MDLPVATVVTTPLVIVKGVQASSVVNANRTRVTGVFITCVYYLSMNNQITMRTMQMIGIQSPSVMGLSGIFGFVGFNVIIVQY